MHNDLSLFTRYKVRAYIRRKMKKQLWNCIIFLSYLTRYHVPLMIYDMKLWLILVSFRVEEILRSFKCLLRGFWQEQTSTAELPYVPKWVPCKRSSLYTWLTQVSSCWPEWVVALSSRKSVIGDAFNWDYEHVQVQGGHEHENRPEQTCMYTVMRVQM